MWWTGLGQEAYGSLSAQTARLLECPRLTDRLSPGVGGNDEWDSLTQRDNIGFIETLGGTRGLPLHTIKKKMYE